MVFFVYPVLFVVLLVTASAFCQLPSSQCDPSGTPIAECAFLTEANSDVFRQKERPLHADDQSRPLPLEEVDPEPNPFVQSRPRKWQEHFHWGRALFESFAFLSIEQGYVIKDDYHWVTVESG